MKNSGASLIILWRDSVPSTHCKRRRWSTRLICAWPTKPTPSFTNRSHFFAVAAQAMRQILVNYAKASQSQKRGGGVLKVELDEVALISPEQTTEILDVHEALERLATLDSRKAHVVELKYFGGLNHDEIAEVLKISTVTVRRDWVFARAWLYNELHNAA